MPISPALFWDEVEGDVNLSNMNIFIKSSAPHESRSKVSFLPYSFVKGKASPVPGPLTKGFGIFVRSVIRRSYRADV